MLWLWASCFTPFKHWVSFRSRPVSVNAGCRYWRQDSLPTSTPFISTFFCINLLPALQLRLLYLNPPAVGKWISLAFIARRRLFAFSDAVLIQLNFMGPGRRNSSRRSKVSQSSFYSELTKSAGSRGAAKLLASWFCCQQVIARRVKAAQQHVCMLMCRRDTELWALLTIIPTLERETGARKVENLSFF